METNHPEAKPSRSWKKYWPLQKKSVLSASVRPSAVRITVSKRPCKERKSKRRGEKRKQKEREGGGAEKKKKEKKKTKRKGEKRFKIPICQINKSYGLTLGWGEWWLEMRRSGLGPNNRNCSVLAPGGVLGDQHGRAGPGPGVKMETSVWKDWTCGLVRPPPPCPTDERGAWLRTKRNWPAERVLQFTSPSNLEYDVDSLFSFSNVFAISARHHLWSIIR